MAPSGATCLVTALGPSVLVVMGASGAEEGSHLAWLTLFGGRRLLVHERGLGDLSIDLTIKRWIVITIKVKFIHSVTPPLFRGRGHCRMCRRGRGRC